MANTQIETTAGGTKVFVSYNRKQIENDATLYLRILELGVKAVTYGGAQKEFLINVANAGGIIPATKKPSPISDEEERRNQFTLDELLALSSERGGVTADSVDDALESLQAMGHSQLILQPVKKHGSKASQAEKLDLDEEIAETLSEKALSWGSPEAFCKPRTLADAARLLRWKDEKDRSARIADLLN